MKSGSNTLRNYIKAGFETTIRHLWSTNQMLVSWSKFLKILVKSRIVIFCCCRTAAVMILWYILWALISSVSNMWLFIERIRSENPPFFFAELFSTPSTLSGIRTFLVKLFGPINEPKEASVNAVTKWQNDLNLSCIQCAEKGFTDRNSEMLWTYLKLWSLPLLPPLNWDV